MGHERTLHRSLWDSHYPPTYEGASEWEPGITVVIPTIPPRRDMLLAAIASVVHQTLAPASLLVVVDAEGRGAAETRRRGLAAVQTRWTAFLDDDDEMYPHHLETLFGHARTTNADYVYSWFDTEPVGCDPFPPNHETDAFDPDNPILTTITTLVRTDLAQFVGFSGTEEDYRFELGCLAAGAVISHAPGRTWVWHHHGKNTSGRGDRW